MSPGIWSFQAKVILSSHLGYHHSSISAKFFNPCNLLQVDSFLHIFLPEYLKQPEKHFHALMQEVKLLTLFLSISEGELICLEIKFVKHQLR